jgi:hypothetical protein
VDTGVDIKEVLKKIMLVICLVKGKIQSFLFIIFSFFEKYFLMGPQDGSDMVVR